MYVCLNRQKIWKENFLYRKENQQISMKNLKGKIPKVLVRNSQMFAFNSPVLFIKFSTVTGERKFSSTVQWKMFWKHSSIAERNRLNEGNNMTHDSQQPYLLFFSNRTKKNVKKKQHIEPFLTTFELRCHLSCIDRSKKRFMMNLKRPLNIFSRICTHIYVLSLWGRVNFF